MCGVPARLLATLLAVGACDARLAEGARAGAPGASAAGAEPAASAGSAAAESAAGPGPRAAAPVPVEPCADRTARVLSSAASPGAPGLEARRAELFARAKADPVLFVRAPREEPASAEAIELRRRLARSADPVKALHAAYPSLRKRPHLAREVLLTEGYLYAENPAFAAALAGLVRPEDLFDEPVIWVARGAEVFSAREAAGPEGRTYVREGGSEAGARLRLYVFDRVAVAREALAPALHRDVGALAVQLGFEELRVRHLDERWLVVEMKHGDVSVPGLVEADGARLALACEAVPAGHEADVARARGEELRRRAVVARLREIIQTQVEEGLPFDEPKTEVGQEDGKLRQHWLWAYRFGQSEFEFNGDRYRVFDRRGRPRVPQVCIDFITDTFERAGGSWYRARGEPRERTPGRLDFGALGIDNGRSVERFVDFARTHPDWFDVVELDDGERVPFQRRKAFFAHLLDHRDRYRPGDVVTIHGLRSDEKLHYHSFFVFDADPVTGAPSLVAANAGRPRIRPWEGEMLTAPRRSIRARIRPRLAWLEALLAPGPGPIPGGAGGAEPGRPAAI